MNRVRTDGFGFLATCALACACGMAGTLGLGSGGPPLERFVGGATGALALVTAEALARVRPWAFGASLARGGMLFSLLGAMVPYVDAIAVLCSLPTRAPRLRRSRVP